MSGRQYKILIVILFVSLFISFPGLVIDSIRVQALGNNIERVSVSDNGTQGNGRSGNSLGNNGSISNDGRYIAFVSAANNLVPNDNNGQPDIFLRDNLQNTTTLISVSDSGIQGNNISEVPCISLDGCHIAFESSANNLIAGDTYYGWKDIFVRDIDGHTTTRASISSDGSEARGDSYCPSLSADGRYVAFISVANNLVPSDTNGYPDIFVRNRQTNTTIIVSISDNGTLGNSWANYPPSISGDGRYVAFESRANNLVSDDTNNKTDIFVRDLLLNKTTRVSVSDNGTEGNDDSAFSNISGNGRYVVFRSLANNLVPNDVGNDMDVFIHDLQLKTTTLISRAQDGSQGNDSSQIPKISYDGRYVVFESWASNLVPGDINGLDDIFVRDMLTDDIIRVSTTSVGTNANNNSMYASISGDGRYVSFESYASNLVPDDTNGVEDVFSADNPLYSPPLVIYVPDDYPTIQAAVDAASPGNTIMVRSGTYVENVNVYKTLTITGINHPVVDANLNRSAITISANDVSLTGFDVTNCGYTSEPFGGGIELNGVQRCYVSGNNAYGNGREGITLINSDNNTIINNRCTNNTEDGIRLWSQSPMTTKNNTIQDNICSNNGKYGIDTWSYVFQTITTKDNVILHNECNSNGYGGIYIGKSSNSTVSNNSCIDNISSGIRLVANVGDTNINNVVTSNVCSNSTYGIWLDNSKSNSINDNEVLNNTGYGIYLQYGASNNHIYLNHFTDNGVANAHTEESTNIWNSPEPMAYSYYAHTYTNYLGNYWSDYQGDDINGDGIGDTPYAIDSDQDNYPLLEQFTRNASVLSATGTGAINLSVSDGNIESFSAVSQNELPCGNLPANTSFPHGFLSYHITDIPPGSSITITLTFPALIAAGAQYWQCNGGEWVDYTPLIEDDDGDEVLTLTVTDGGAGDCDGLVNGEISDPGGPALAIQTTAPTGGVSPSLPNRQLNQAQISLQYLNINPEQARIDQPLTITGNVVNTGDQAGNYNLSLKINGTVEQTKMISVGPHAAQPVKFTLTKSQPGTYTVDIGGQRETFTVFGESSRKSSMPNSNLIILAAMGILALVAVVILMISRRST